MNTIYTTRSRKAAEALKTAAVVFWEWLCGDRSLTHGKD